MNCSAPFFSIHMVEHFNLRHLFYMNISLKNRFKGLMIGTAVGDSLGLPAEGVPKNRAQKMFPDRWQHRFLPGMGMISDDTEHTLFVAQGLLAHHDSADAFAQSLAWSFRWWFAALPAGIGLATARSIIKLWFIEFHIKLRRGHRHSRSHHRGIGWCNHR